MGTSYLRSWEGWESEVALSIRCFVSMSWSPLCMTEATRPHPFQENLLCQLCVGLSCLFQEVFQALLFSPQCFKGTSRLGSCRRSVSCRHSGSCPSGPHPEKTGGLSTITQARTYKATGSCKATGRPWFIYSWIGGRESTGPTCSFWKDISPPELRAQSPRRALLLCFLGALKGDRSIKAGVAFGASWRTHTNPPGTDNLSSEKGWGPGGPLVFSAALTSTPASPRRNEVSRPGDGRKWGCLGDLCMAPHNPKRTGHFPPHLYRKHHVARILVHSKRMCPGVRPEEAARRLDGFSNGQ